MNRPPVRPVAACATTLALALCARSATAQGSAATQPPPDATRELLAPTVPAQQDQEPLDSLEQGTVPLEASFAEDYRERIRRQRRAALDATAYDLHLRSYYLDRDKFDDTQSEAWAFGGWAGLKTGHFRDVFAVGATAYFSLPLYAPEDKDGTRLLLPGQEGYAVLGELYGELKLGREVLAHLGRKAYETPYINRYDIRMTPNTFEAYTVSGRHGGTEKDPEWRWGAGYFDQIKEIDSDEFVPMSEALGVAADRGVYAAGANWRSGDFSLGAIDYYSDDIINIAYTEAKYALPLADEMRLQFGAQYSDQRSTGDELLHGSDFAGHQYGLKGELAWGPALFTVARTSTSEGASMESPWGGYPGYTSVQVENFNRAGEDAFIARAAWTFPRLPGLSTYALWVHGTDPVGASAYAEDEYDFNLQWSAPKGRFEGLTLRFRYALVQQHGGGDADLTDLRFIVYYDPPGL